VKILFAGGGTGGHLYPAIALAEALDTRAEIRFAGSADRLERTIVPGAGYALDTVCARPLKRSLSPELFATVWANAIGIVQAMRLLARFSPDVIVATGGYVCFPVVAAAKLLRLAGKLHARISLLEPNAVPGLTNRLLEPLVDEVWVAFPRREQRGKYLHTGVPVRRSILRSVNRVEAARRLGLDPSRRTVLAIGGSQGARSVNEAVAALVTRRQLPPDWQVLHVSGRRDYAYMQAEERDVFEGNAVVLVPYLEDMGDAYAVCDAAVARAGASTLAELAAVGVPSVLVPYPFASEDHQTANAREFESRGAAAVLADRDLNADSLWWTLRSVMEPARLAQMRDAARSLAGRDAIAAILARIDALSGRKSAA